MLAPVDAVGICIVEVLNDFPGIDLQQAVERLISGAPPDTAQEP